MNKAQKLGFLIFTLVFTLFICGVATVAYSDPVNPQITDSVTSENPTTQVNSINDQTIPMQSTGAPLLPLLLGALMVVIGLFKPN